jgi:hypothetical protein
MRPFWGGEVGYPRNPDAGVLVAEPNGELSPPNFLAASWTIKCTVIP